MRRRERWVTWILSAVFAFAMAAGEAVAQDKVIPVKLRNGCALDLPVRFDANSVTLMLQDFMPSSCPASGRYTGMISMGMSIQVVFTTSEKNYLQVRSGKVNDGKFEYILTQNEAQWQGLVWEDSSGKKISVEIPREAGSDGINSARRQLASALASRESPSLDNSARDFLSQRVLDWNRGHTRHLQRYTAGVQNRFGVSSASGENDHPKVRGRSARGG